MAGKPTIAEAWVGLTPSLDGASGKINKELSGIDVSAAGSAVGSVFGGALFKTAAKFAAPLLAVLGGTAILSGIGNVFEGAIDSASTLNESVNAVNVVYGDLASGVEDLSERSANALGLTSSDFNSLSVQFSNFVKTVAGEGGDVTGTLDDLTTRAADFASVMNLDVAEAATLFQSGLAGETEPLRRYGIDLSAASVQAFALANGIGDGTGALTEAEKVQARYGSLMAQTANTQGDFANTSDSLANAQRRLNAQWENIQAQLGTALLPFVAKFTDLLADSMPVVSELAGFVIDLFEALGLSDIDGKAFTDFIEAMRPALDQFALVANESLKPALAELGAVFVRDLLPALVEIAPPMAELLSLIIQFATPAVVGTALIFVKVLAALLGDLSVKTRAVVALFEAWVGNMQIWRDAVLSNATKILDWFRALPDNIRTALSRVADYIAAPFKAAFNQIASLWNKSVGKLSFSLPGVGNVSMPKIPMLADGGVVTRPTLAMIGEGGQSEAVIPLDRAGDFGFGGNDEMTGLLRQVRDELKKRQTIEAFGTAIARTATQGQQLLAAGGGV